MLARPRGCAALRSAARAVYANPPAWLPAAVSAHANGTEVARFVRDVLMRNDIDNRGQAYVATINCLWGHPLTALAYTAFANPLAAVRG
jgi:hypothetical protein